MKTITIPDGIEVSSFINYFKCEVICEAGNDILSLIEDIEKISDRLFILIEKDRRSLAIKRTESYNEKTNEVYYVKNMIYLICYMQRPRMKIIFNNLF